MSSQSIDMQCWKCGTELEKLILPFSRNEECSNCKADLHACLACEHYDPSVADACNEDRADFVLDKDKANFCDYFKANPKSYRPKDAAKARAAQVKLNELFNIDPEKAKESAANSPQSEADEALAKLNNLFGNKE